MGKGIKKISENVIADKRSLILVVSSNNPDDVIANTDAMPLGMLKADYYNKGLDMKIGKNYDGDAIWSKLDADYSLCCYIKENPKSYNSTNKPSSKFCNYR